MCIWYEVYNEMGEYEKVSQMKSLFFQKDLFFRTRIMRTSYDKKSHISNNNVYIIHMVSLSLQFDKHSFFCGW